MLFCPYLTIPMQNGCDENYINNNKSALQFVFTLHSHLKDLINLISICLNQAVAVKNSAAHVPTQQH